MKTLIHIAGLVHLVLVAANFAIPRKLDYAASAARMSPIVRQVFWVHAAYIVFVLAGFAALCFAFPADLAGGSVLGRSLSAFIAVFWGARVVVHLAVYDRSVRRANRAMDVVFLAMFGFLAAVFTLAAIGGLR
jgi:hypothetical protein